MLVAVYGTLKKGFENHHFLKKALFLGEAVSVGKFYLGHASFPAVVPSKKGAPIAVELYEVSKGTMKVLDRLEGYPSHYNRGKFLFKLNDGKTVEAWLYYYRHISSWHDWDTSDYPFPWVWEKEGWVPYYSSEVPWLELLKEEK